MTELFEQLSEMSKAGLIQKNEEQKKIISALMDGHPSGLTVGQARSLLGKLEAENKALKAALQAFVDEIGECTCIDDYKKDKLRDDPHCCYHYLKEEIKTAKELLDQK